MSPGYQHGERTMGRLIVQELCESRGGRPGLSVLMSLLVSVDVKLCVGTGHSLSLICLMTSEDIKHQLIIIASCGRWLSK